MACKVSKSLEWNARLLHELEYFPERSFVTLTYDWASIPRRGRRLTLRRCDLTNFFKRLRKSLPGRVIKYYACGEYGDRHGRPHYHVILFGVGVDEHECIKQGLMRGVAVSGPVLKAWPNGIVYVSGVGRESIAYVADYLKKTWKGKKANRVYGGSARPFQVVSQGIGKRYAIKNEKQIRALLGLTVRGAQVGLPRYYRKVLGITAENTPELAERAEKAQYEIYEKVVERVLKDGVPDGMTFDGALHKVIREDRLQAERDLSAKVQLYRRGKV